MFRAVIRTDFAATLDRRRVARSRFLAVVCGLACVFPAAAQQPLEGLRRVPKFGEQGPVTPAATSAATPPIGSRTRLAWRKAGPAGAPAKAPSAATPAAVTNKPQAAGLAETSHTAAIRQVSATQRGTATNRLRRKPTGRTVPQNAQFDSPAAALRIVQQAAFQSPQDDGSDSMNLPPSLQPTPSQPPEEGNNDIFDRVFGDPEMQPEANNQDDPAVEPLPPPRSNDQDDPAMQVPPALEPTPLQPPADTTPQDLQPVPEDAPAPKDLQPEPEDAPAPQDRNPMRMDADPQREPASPNDRGVVPNAEDDAGADDRVRPPANAPLDSDTYSNPFERARQQRENALGNRQRNPLPSAKEYSCDEFRDALAARTIDKISLDISPPFRPDILEADTLEREREKFLEEQPVRQWRSIDGFVMAKGRLRGIAYENVLVEAEHGGVEQLSINRISEADLAYLNKAWGLPRECRIRQAKFRPRNWTPSQVRWTASGLCHKPLYFEEVNLERYGHTAGPALQPVLSSAHFFVNIAFLPYKMGIHPPTECQYTLGYYRPGSCAPWVVPPVPLSLRGAVAQAATVSGLGLLIP